MAEEKFKLPKSSYEELVKVIKGYAQFDGAVGLGEVSKQTGLHPTIISRNVGFLVGIQVLEGGRDKQCTGKGRGLAQALMHEMPEEIRRLWATVVNECEFLTRVVAAVRIRQGMDESTISSHIAYSAGQPKNPAVMTGARTVVDILRAAELLREQDGKLSTVNVVTVNAIGSDQPSVTTPVQPSGVPSMQVTPQTMVAEAHMSSSPGQAVARLSIDVRVTCTPADLDGLAAKLKQLMRELATAPIGENSGTAREGE